MKKEFFTLFILCLSFSVSAQQILSVTPALQPPYDNMTNLIRDHLTGSGVEIISVQSDNDPAAIGYFTDGDSAIGLKRGLVLTTGLSGGIDQTGNHFASTINSGSGVQPELQSISSGSSLNDVAYFRITFRPFSDSIQFRYVFASEEYPEFACSNFNDIFGFFLSGPNPDGGMYDDLNIALIPGTNLPVAINNLHPVNPNLPPCPPLNLQFYHDNLNSSSQPVYDGFTDVFEAVAKVTPCGIYEMVIAIADVDDSVYDSGVFLEAKSLESPLEIATSLVLGDDVIPENAIADTLSFTFNNVPSNLLPLQITIEGTAANGIDYQSVNATTTINAVGEIAQFIIQPIPDSLNETIETVEFKVYSNAGSDCLVQTFTLYIADPDSLYSPVDSVELLPNGTVFLSVVPTSVSNKIWTFSSAAPKSIAPSLVMVKSDIQVGIPFDILDDIRVLQSVCLNIEHNWDDDLDLFLVAPNGTFVELSTDNGGNGHNYTNTCFSPSATTDIRGGEPFAPASAAPFSGTFQPEGLWSDILGTPITGVWSLGIVDDQNGISGTLLDWSIAFSTYDLGNFKYLWNTGDTTPTIQVSAEGNYSVVVHNEVGSFSKMFVVGEASVGTNSPETGGAPFRLSPNPSTGETALILDKHLNVNAVKVYNLNGELVLEQNTAGPIIGSGNLPGGIFIVTLECSEGVFVQKLVRR